MDISNTHKLVPRIREASRLLVRELGFMSPTLAGTDLAPSCLHAMVDIRHPASPTASGLSKTLILDRSNISQKLAKPVEAGAVTQKPSVFDGR